MKLSDQILRKPFYVAFGQALQGGGITSVDLVVVRDAATVTMTASDGSAAPIAGADASTAGVMTAADKSKLDSLPPATARDFATKLEVATSTIGAGITHLRTAGHSAAGDGGGTLYKRVASPPPHTLKVQSTDGAWWELVPDAGGINVRQAGAVGDGVADDTQPIQDCIDFLGDDNGKVLLPRGSYKTTATIRVEDNVILEGEGYGTMTIGRSTVIEVASGVTGFIVQRANENYGDNALFRNLEIASAGKNATTTTGTMSSASKTLTLAAAEDFADGDIIMVRGAGESQTLMNSNYLTAATTAASTAVTLSNAAGIYDGMVIEVAGANFPADTYVVSRSGTNVVMSAPAADTVTAGKITYYNDLAVQVLSGGGTTTLTVNEAAFRAVSGAEVLHYDCGIYAQSRMSVERCVVRDFQGAGLMIHAGGDVDNEFGKATNANDWNVRDARFTACRNGLRLKGNDVNAGTAVGVDVGSNTEYGLVDASFLGNYFFGLHVSGAYGYMTVFVNAWATFVACYTEGGSKNSFAGRTQVIGGAMNASNGNVAGGNAMTSDINAIYQSSTSFYPAWHDYGLTLGNQSAVTNGVMFLNGPDGPNVNFKRTSTAGGGQDGLWGWHSGGAIGGCGMFFSDSDADKGAGNAYFLKGMYIGRDQGSVTQSNFRRVAGANAVPTTGTWSRGDRVLNHSPVAGGFAGWICITAGTPGVWKGFGAIEA